MVWEWDCHTVTAFVLLWKWLTGEEKFAKFIKKLRWEKTCLKHILYRYELCSPSLKQSLKEWWFNSDAKVDIDGSKWLSKYVMRITIHWSSNRTHNLFYWRLHMIFLYKLSHIFQTSFRYRDIFRDISYGILIEHKFSISINKYIQWHWIWNHS